MALYIRSWMCNKYGALPDRDINAFQNICAGTRMIAAGTVAAASRGPVSQICSCR